MAPAMLTHDRYLRQDVLFLLNTDEIDLPLLHDRREDVPELLDHFLILYAKRYGQPVPAITPEAMTALRHHDWPGTVRALRHAVERAVILSGGQPLQPHDFPIGATARSEEHTSELQSLMRTSYDVFCLKLKK